MESLFTIIRFLFLFFFPGLLLSLMLFDGKKIDILERIALSFGLSIALVPLGIFYFHLLGMQITIENVAIFVICLCGLGLIGWAIRKWMEHEKK